MAIVPMRLLLDHAAENGLWHSCLQCQQHGADSSNHAGGR